MQLYINTYGAYLHIKDELFEIRLPKGGGEYEKRHFAAAKVTAIILTTSAALSTDAVALALRHNIDVLFSGKDGHPLGRVWHSKLGSTTRIRKRQLEASLGADGVRYTLQWLTAKLDAQAQLLQDLKKHRAPLQTYLDEHCQKIANLRVSMALLEGSPGVDAIADTLRGLEGTAGRLYFGALSACLPKEHQFKGRSFRPAADLFNAFLNYAYGILYARVEKALMIAGLDPYVGFLHRDDYNQKSMVFDFIEPYRPWMDKVVFQLFSRKKVNQSHVEALANGVTLAKPGKEMLIEHVNDFLEVQTLRYRNRNLTRATAMQLDAHQFAQQLLGRGEQADLPKTENL